MFSDADRAVLLYLQLAVVSERKQQRPGRNRFLVLTAAAACTAGLSAVAERCRLLVLGDNPRHLLGQFDSVAAAMRSDALPSLVKQLQRQCSLEQAEHLLSELFPMNHAPQTEHHRPADAHSSSPDDITFQQKTIEDWLEELDSA